MEWEITKHVVESSLTELPDTWASFGECQVIQAYTDGSAPIRNPGGPAGFAAVLVGYPDLIDSDKLLSTNPSARLDLSGYIPARATEPLTSNNRAEIAGVLAVLEALRHLGQAPHAARRVVIWSDSTYVVNCADGAWQRKKNTDLWPVLDRLVEEARRWVAGDVAIRWIRGHAGNQYNEIADELATRAAFNFDETVYLRHRAAQTATGREMPGSKALSRQSPATTPTSAAPATSQPQSAEKPRSQTASRSIDPAPWLTGADYTLVLLTHIDGGGQPGVGRGPGTGRYYLFANDGRNRQITVDHPGERIADEAEYLTLISALSDMCQRITTGGRDPANYSLTIYSRRELVVKQLIGTYRVKSPALQYTFAEARGLLGRFKSVELVWKRGGEIEALFRA